MTDLWREWVVGLIISRRAKVKARCLISSVSGTMTESPRLLKATDGKLVHGGELDRETKFIQPAIATDVTLQGECF